MDRLWIILNPNAGSAEAAGEILAWAAERDGVDARVTGSAGDAERYAREAAAGGAAAVAAAGGDGTIGEVVNGLAPDFAIPLGVLPLGTGNDFVRANGLPLDPQACLCDPDAFATRAVDVVRVEAGGNTRYMINAAAGGFSEVATDKLTSRLKSLLGPVSYLVAAYRAARNIPWHKLDVDADGDRFACRACAVMVGNGPFAGGGQRFAPAATLDSGRVELVVITAETLRQRARLFARYLAGRHLRDARVVHRSARRLRLIADPPMAFTIDGERFGETPVSWSVLPGALVLLLPESADVTAGR